MKVNAVAVSSVNIRKTVRFYKILGINFPEFSSKDKHVESIPIEGSVKIMIDDHDLIREIIGEKPIPSNHSPFAIEYNSAEEVNHIVEKIKEARFTIVKQPWDAFWGQRYAIIADPDGYKVDLYAKL